MEDFPNNPTNENPNIEQNNAEQNDIEQTDANEAIDREDALDRGDKANNAVLAVPTTVQDSDAIEGKKWLWKNQRKLHNEMKKLGVPFNPDEFKKQGFAFTKDNKDETHVLFPTSEYSEWLNSPEEERGPRPIRHHETPEERANKLRLEELQLAEEKQKLWVGEKMNEAKSLFPNNEKFSETMNGWSYKRQLALAQDMQAYQKILSEKNHHYSDQYIEQIYSKTISDLSIYGIPYKVLEDDTRIDIEGETIKRISRADMIQRDGWSDEFQTNSMRVQEELFKKSEYGERIAEKTKQYINSSEALGLAQEIIKNSIKEKKFLRNGDIGYGLDKLLERFGIDKNSSEIINLAFESYTNRYNNAFQISRHTAEATFNGEEYPIKLAYEYRQDWLGHGGFDFVLKNENGVVKDGSDAAFWLRRIIEENVGNMPFSQDEKFVSAVEEDKNDLMEGLWGLAEKAVGAHIDLEELLSVRERGLGNYTYHVRRYITDNYGEVFEKCATDVFVKDQIVDIDYEEAKENMKKGLLKILQEGTIERFSKKDLKNGFQVLDIDLSSQEVLDASIDGFIEVVSDVNGETSGRANWYYENIFAKNPDEFYSRMIDLKKNKDCPRGLKAKITKFMNTNESYQEYEQKRLFEKMARDAERKERSSTYRSILRNASGEDINELIRKRQEELVGEIKEAGAEEVETFYARSKRLDAADSGDELKAEAPKDFGVRKVEMLKTWKEYIEANYFNDALEENKPKFFIDTFPVANVDNGKLDNVVLDDDLSYIGFQFEYEGNLCVIAESFNVDAGMYLFRGKPGDNFKEMFDGSKAHSLKDPRVVRVDHLDRENMEDSIDLVYQKAFLFLRTGDKSVVHYNVFGNNAREDWEEYRDIEYPAWPMNIENEEIDPEELERYREWQRRQEENI